MYTYGEEIEFELTVLSPNSDKLLGDFDCGTEVFNNYIRNDSYRDNSCVTYIVTDKAAHKTIGFASLACSGICFQVDNYRKTLPAIEIKYFAIVSEYQKLRQNRETEHLYFSDRILCELIKRCYDISTQIIGAEYIVLYSVPSAVWFYRRNKFNEYNQYMNPDNTLFLEGCTPMFMNL